MPPRALLQTMHHRQRRRHHGQCHHLQRTTRPAPARNANANALGTHRQDKTIVLPFKNGQNNILLQCPDGKEQQDHLYQLFHKVWAFERANSFLR